VTEPDGVAGSLIDALAKQGEHYDEGGFTMDPAVALAKLREHQLADLHGYVLLLVEAAWIAGDSEHGVHINTGATTTAAFDGVTLEAAALRELFTAALASLHRVEGEELRRRRVLQLLALAANSALRLVPLAITIDARDASGKVWRARIDPSGELTVEPGPQLGHAAIRFSLQGGGLLGLGRPAAERNLLVERCRCSSFLIFVDGRRISHGPGILIRRGHQRPIRLDGREIGLAGHGADLLAPPTHIAVNRGVSVKIPGIPGPLGIVSVVEVDLPMDLSRQQLLLGPELEAVEQAIRKAVAKFSSPHYAESAVPDRPKGKTPVPLVVIVVGALWLVAVLYEILTSSR
jgi:hypothetical protein